ncbi:unnamed protein product [Thelazia callipaeda]|uniref:C3HC-type domain-containing protein n=1 Tax=Thelazia callipaeda TaxID=103827 RepID=A0A158RCN1_THECL|nr:unnamed protein product [Thelazia callipaeda]
MEKIEELAHLKENALELLHQAHEQTRTQQQRLSVNGKCWSNYDKFDSKIEKRLQSFTLAKWVGKPKKLSPLVFAIHGWVCVAPDMVHCAVCDQYMSVVLPKLAKVEVEVFQKSVRKLISLITKKHRVICPYRHTSFGSNDGIPFHILPKGLIDERCKTMNKLDLEEIKVTLSDISSSVVFKTAMQKYRALVCFGWQKNRRVALWLLRGNVFDVEKQHYKWCAFATHTSHYPNVGHSRRLILQCFNNSEDLSATSCIANAEIWKSFMMGKDDTLME